MLRCLFFGSRADAQQRGSCCTFPPQFFTVNLLFPECPASVIADVVFLVDGSWSVGRPNFKYIRTFISATAGAFQIGKDRTRVSVVQYGDDARTEFNLKEHLTRPVLLRAIGSLPYKGGNTMTGEALFLMLSLDSVISFLLLH